MESTPPLEILMGQRHELAETLGRISLQRDRLDKAYRFTIEALINLNDRIREAGGGN